MDIDGEKLEQTVLALLHLTSFKVHHPRAWKGHESPIRKGLHLGSGYQSQICRVYRGRCQKFLLDQFCFDGRAFTETSKTAVMIRLAISDFPVVVGISGARGSRPNRDLRLYG